jgi:hypothetical protein
MDRSLLVTLLVAVLVVFASSFAFADFGVATTNATVESQVSTASVNDTTLPPPQPVYLHVATDDGVSRRIADRFAAALEERGYVVTRAETLRADYGAPAVVVGVADRSLRYNPVAPAGTVRVRLLFVDSGNLSRLGPAGPFDAARFRERFLADETGVMRMDNRTQFVREGTLEVDVRQRGVVTAPYFRGVVAETTADAVLDALFG